MMAKIRSVKSKSFATIKEEWDAIAELRQNQITCGKDISYRHVILPCILELSKDCDFTSVIDIGCGLGILEKEIAPRCDELIGIDISAKSLEYAKKLCQEFSNIRFVNELFENFASRIDPETFTLTIANMTLMTCLNLDSMLRAIQKILRSGGSLVVTITHPCFWPDYWGYLSAEWFNYRQEIIIEGPLRISTETSEYVTTHVHRSLEKYITSLLEFGFEIRKFLEPMPNSSIEAKYPSAWKYPRFLGIECIRK